MQYYTLNSDGVIDAFADFKFREDCLETEREIVRAYDGKIYFADEAPQKPGELAREEFAAQRRAEILSRMNALDAASIRPLRAIAGGKGTEVDRKRLAGIEREMASLRGELAALPG